MASIVTATTLFNYKKCPYRPYLDYNGDPALKLPIHPLVKLLWESGVQYEAKVIEAYRKDHPELSFRAINPDDPVSDALAQETIQAMRDGVDIIYQGVLIDGNRVGRPDLLLKTAGDSSWGNYHYYPMDIKLTREEAAWDDGREKVPMEQYWQVYFYGELLEALQGRKPTSGFIYKTKARQLAIRLRDPPYNYQAALAQIDFYGRGDAHGAEPAICSACNTCEWKTSCAAWANERRDLSLIFYVGQAMKAGLKQLGIRTIEELAKQNPEELAARVAALKAQGFFWKSMPENLVQRSITRARIHLDGKPVIHQRIAFPDTAKELHFDLEDDPTQDFVYLFGVLLSEKGKAPTYHSFFANSREEERAITLALFDFLNQQADATLYHYSDYEKTTLKRLVSKHKLDPAVYERLFGKHGTAIDLYKIILEHTDWPLTSYSVKPICKLLGFQWDASDAGGAASIVWINEYLAGDTSMKAKILRYNEDDCRATYFLKDALIKMQN